MPMSEQPDPLGQARIDAYVAGKLAGEDLHAFEAEMALHAELRTAVETERLLRETVARAPELRFRDLVQQVSDEQERAAAGDGDAEASVIPIDRGRLKWWWAAASVAVAIGVVAVFSVQRPDPQELAIAEVRAFSLSVRGDSIETDAHIAMLMEAKQLILDHKPNDAIKLLQDQRGTVCEDAERQWFIGAAYLVAGDPGSAREELEHARRAGCAISPKAEVLLKAL